MKEVITSNHALSELINSQRRDDGQIIEGVYIAMSYNLDTKRLIHFWAGTREAGPMLSYAENANKSNKLDALSNDWGWSPIYSQGNYGKNYSHGGNWSVQCQGIHPRLVIQDKQDKETELFLIGDGLITLPEGIKGDITLHNFDCSHSWAIWYDSAIDAIKGRLSIEEIESSSLSKKTKDHLIPNEAESLEKLRELVNVFNI